MEARYLLQPHVSFRQDGDTFGTSSLSIQFDLLVMNAPEGRLSIGPCADTVHSSPRLSCEERLRSRADNSGFWCICPKKVEVARLLVDHTVLGIVRMVARWP